MSVHIGRLTSEVTASGGNSNAGGGDDEEQTPWERQRRIMAAFDQAYCRHLRTATGYGDD